MLWALLHLELFGFKGTSSLWKCTHQVTEELAGKEESTCPYFLHSSLPFSFLLSREFITSWFILPSIAFCLHVLNQVFISTMENEVQKRSHIPYFFYLPFQHVVTNIFKNLPIVLDPVAFPTCCWERAFYLSPFPLQWNLECFSQGKHTMC